MIQIPNKLKIKQKIELLEVIFDFEASNKYEILSENGDKFLFAFEKSHLIFKFIFQKNRPCTIYLVDSNKQEQIIIKRNFFFFFSSYSICSGDGEMLGYIKRNFAFLNTKYTIYDNNNTKIATLDGPFWRPWTFNIKDENDQKIGLIGKKFSGMKEIFTDSDNFGFEVEDNILDPNLRALILAATFAVDYDNFDRAG